MTSDLAGGYNTQNEPEVFRLWVLTSMNDISAPAREHQSAESKLKELKRRLLEISDLGSASAVLSWDQATYMPKGGGPSRGRQGAILRKLAHERSIDPTLGKLLDELAPYAAGLSQDSDDACLIHVARRDFEKAIKLPPEFVARFNEHGSASYDAWTRARPANDFADRKSVV